MDKCQKKELMQRSPKIEVASIVDKGARIHPNEASPYLSYMANEASLVINPINIYL